MSNNFYIYRHIRLDTNTPFYVGKGKCKRAYKKSSRNKYWRNIVNLVGYEVEIMLDNLSEQEAINKEVEFIKLYKSLCYCEANMTDGGDGQLGNWRKNNSVQEKDKPSKKGFILRYGEEEGIKKYKEYCNKISISRKGKCNFRTNLEGFISIYGDIEGLERYDAWRKANSESKLGKPSLKKGKPGNSCTEKQKINISRKNKGKVPWNKGLTKETNESLKLMANSKKGNKASKETRRKMSAVRLGRKHSNPGTLWQIKYLIYDSIEIIKNLRKFCKEHNINENQFKQNKLTDKYQLIGRISK